MPTSIDHRLAVAQFLDVAAEVTGAARAQIADMAQALLAAPSFDALAATSSLLNADGTPVELCVTVTPERRAVRLIGDAAAHVTAGGLRIAQARDATLQVFTVAGASTLTPLATDLIDRVTSGEWSTPDDWAGGVAWLAASPDDPGAAVYVDAGVLGDRAWPVAREWLAHVLPARAVSDAIVAGLQPQAVVASLSIEGVARARGRAKLYIRLREPMALSHWGAAVFQDDTFLRFLRLAMRDRHVDVQGLVAAIGFDLATGAVADAKVDLCGHCLAYQTDEWRDVIEQCRQSFDLTPPDVDQALTLTSVAFIGFGVSVSGAPRMNVYLKPQGRDGNAATDRAVTRAIDYLVATQRADGAWEDFALPVGASDQWVTAYVGFSLAIAGREHPVARRAAERAAAWLTTHRTYPAGWGFNGTTGPDADSTAFALALFRELGVIVDARDQQFLLGHWQPRGGISTYVSPDAWGHAHIDVTPLAFLGLPEDAQRDHAAAMIDYLTRGEIAPGVWPSYWWRSSAYATFAVRALFAALDLEQPSAASAATADLSDAFDLACVVGAERLRGARVEQVDHLRAHLLRLQQADGSWRGHAILRVTDQDCARPWVDPRGALYDDTNGALTTATAVRALTSPRR